MPVGSSVWVYGLVTADAWTGTAQWAVTNQTLAPGKVLTEITIGGENLDVAAITARAHYVEVLDGAWTGLMLDVFNCTATKVIVHGDCAVMEPGTRLAVRAHATLGTMFPVPDCGLVAGADVVMAACPDGAGDFTERWFMHNGDNWEQPGSPEPADDVVVYPGQGMIFTLGELPGGAAREVVFGRGPVCHVKDTPTLVTVYASWAAAQFAGPVWPVEADDSGGLRTTDIAALGLESLLSPYEDIACLLAWNGTLDCNQVFFSDGQQLVDGVTLESGSNLYNLVRHVNGSALYFGMMTSRHWLTPGVP